MTYEEALEALPEGWTIDRPHRKDRCYKARKWVPGTGESVEIRCKLMRDAVKAAWAHERKSNGE